MSDSPRRTTRFLGWGLIALVGGGATLVSLAIVAVGVLVADIFVLKPCDVQTSYLTIVRQKGVVGSPAEPSGYLYQVKDAAGSLQDLQMPWAAEPGTRVRLRGGKSRLLRLQIPTEVPVLCGQGTEC